MLPPVPPSEDSERLKTLLSSKYRYGMLYGAFTGLIFACMVWGFDGLRLSQAHALFPWLKFGLGLVMCLVLGMLAGRLAAQLDKTHWSVLIWLVTIAAFAWLSLVIPFILAPRLTVWWKPELQAWLNFTYYPEFQFRFGVTLIWCLLFGVITGFLQLPLTESAVYSTSLLGKGVPLLLPLILMIVAGSWVDNNNNGPLRNALLNLDQAIQYTLDHEGQTIAPNTVLDLHLYAITSVQDLIDRPRWLTVRSYNSTLDDVHLIVQFGDTRVDCETVSEQPLFCTRPGPTAP